MLCAKFQKDSSTDKEAMGKEIFRDIGLRRIADTLSVLLHAPGLEELCK